LCKQLLLLELDGVRVKKYATGAGEQREL